MYQGPNKHWEMAYIFNYNRCFIFTAQLEGTRLTTSYKKGGEPGTVVHAWNPSTLGG